MNRLLVLALAGGFLYWLLKEPARRTRPEPPLPEDDRPAPYSEDDLLDEALEESFPASDSPAVTPPPRAPGDVPR